MKEQNKLKKRYRWLYRVYFTLSFVPVLLCFQLGCYFYLTKFRQYVTFSHLFLLVLLLIFALYLRINAFHYQNIAITIGTKLPQSELKKEAPKKGKIRRETSQR